MKYIGLLTLILGIVLLSCKSANNKTEISENITEEQNSVDSLKELAEIQELIYQVMNWSGSNESIELLPTVSDNIDSIYIGFDKKLLNENLNKLRQTNFFSNEFIENYNQIIQTLDKKIRNKEIEWFVGDLPPFNFSSDVNPWCLCQDIPSGNMGEVKIKMINNKFGELVWKWGKENTSWIDFKILITKEDNKWKVSYMEGFDYNESIR